MTLPQRHVKTIATFVCLLLIGGVSWALWHHSPNSDTDRGGSVSLSTFTPHTPAMPNPSLSSPLPSSSPPTVTATPVATQSVQPDAVRIGGITHRLDGINTKREINQLVLYTRAAGSTTPTNA